MATDGPRVIPEKPCDSKSWKWWPGSESNQRHADFRYDGEPGSARARRRNTRARRHTDRIRSEPRGAAPNCLERVSGVARAEAAACALPPSSAPGRAHDARPTRGLAATPRPSYLQEMALITAWASEVAEAACSVVSFFPVCALTSCTKPVSTAQVALMSGTA